MTSFQIIAVRSASSRAVEFNLHDAQRPLADGLFTTGSRGELHSGDLGQIEIVAIFTLADELDCDRPAARGSQRDRDVAQRPGRRTREHFLLVNQYANRIAS